MIQRPINFECKVPEGDMGPVGDDIVVSLKAMIRS